MKQPPAFFLMLALLLSIGCAQDPQPAPEPNVDPGAEMLQVKTVIDRFVQTLEAEDIEAFSQIMAHDNDMVNLGTNASEYWVGWPALKRAVQKQYAAFENTKLSVREQVVKIARVGNVAWFAQTADWDVVAGGQPIKIKGSRLTGVLEKRDGAWLVVQFHASLPLAAQPALHEMSGLLK